MQRAGNNSEFPLGEAILKARSLFPDSFWYWIGVGALFGFTLLFNILFTFSLTFLNRKCIPHHPTNMLTLQENGTVSMAKVSLYFCVFIMISCLLSTLCQKLRVALGKRQAVVSEEELQEKDTTSKGEPVIIQLRDYLQFSGSLASKRYSIFNKFIYSCYKLP